MPAPLATALRRDDLDGDLDAAGRVAGTWQIGTVETTTTYDVRSRLTGLSARTWNFSSDDVTPLFGAAYAYAPNGLVTQATFQRPAATTAQAVRPDGSLDDDFVIAQTPRAVHVVNAPSPAATASLAIGREIAALALARVPRAVQIPVAR